MEMAGSDKEKLLCDEGDMEKEKANSTDCSLSTPPAPIHHSPNPDPPQHKAKTTLNQDILRKRPTLKELLELLAPICGRWNDIGRALHADHNFLRSLETCRNTATVVKLDKVIHQWLMNDIRHLITWGDVIAVIEGDIVNNKKIADKIRKYLAERQ